MSDAPEILFVRPGKYSGWYGGYCSVVDHVDLPHKFIEFGVHESALAAKDKRIEELERERDEWQKMVGKICATVPLPDTIKATGSLGDLINYLKANLKAPKGSDR